MAANDFVELMDRLAFGEESRTRAWLALEKAGLAPDDREALRIVLHLAAQDDADNLRGAAVEVAAAAKDAITAASKSAVADLNKAAVLQGETLDKRMAATMAEVQASQQRTVEAVAAEVGKASEVALLKLAAAKERGEAVFDYAIMAAVTGAAAFMGWQLRSMAAGVNPSAYLGNPNEAPSAFLAWIIVGVIIGLAIPGLRRRILRKAEGGFEPEEVERQRYETVLASYKAAADELKASASTMKHQSDCLVNFIRRANT
jgi:hypothetical protein